MRVELRDRIVSVRSGKCCVVSRGLEHRTCAGEEAVVVLFEPAATRNTGNVVDERFTAPDGSAL
jgi:mannose-6-phosphate isomerase-like protein (cupin superfamily)